MKFINWWEYFDYNVLLTTIISTGVLYTTLRKVVWKNVIHKPWIPFKKPNYIRVRLHYRNTLCIGNLTPCIFTCCTISIPKCILDANTVYRRSQILFIQRISHIFRRIFKKLSNINRKTFRLFLISGFLFLEIGYNLDLSVFQALVNHCMNARCTSRPSNYTIVLNFIRCYELGVTYIVEMV